MMAVAVQSQRQRVASWEEYLRLPLTRYEIIDGEVFELPTPSLKHQDIVSKLLAILSQHVRENSLGKVFPAPFDFVIRRQPLRTRQPHLFYLSRESIGNLDALMEQPRLEIAPDLVIEVLSPSDTYTAWRDKLHDYHTLGVPEVWAVDIERQEIEVLVREPRGYSSHGWFTGDEPILSKVLPELRLTPKSLFED
jgi:Uma2 family endonuclease